MKEHPFAEPIELLKSIGADHMRAYEVYRNSGHHITAQYAYNRGCAFNCAARLLSESRPGMIDGPTPPRPSASDHPETGSPPADTWLHHYIETFAGASDQRRLGGTTP